MSIAAIVHIHGEDAILADLDDMPNPNHNFIMLRNIRKKDGKPLTYIDDGATAFLYAWSRISFIEMIGDLAIGQQPAGVARPAGTTVLGFFREDDDER